MKRGSKFLSLGGQVFLLFLASCVLPEASGVFRGTPTSISSATSPVQVEEASTETFTASATPQAINSPTVSPVPTAQPTATPDQSFTMGITEDIDGLQVSLSIPILQSGCDGTMDLEITLTNQTDNPIVLGLDDDDIELLGGGAEDLSVYAELGAYSPRCYGSFTLEAIAPQSEVTFAVRTRDSLGSYSHVDIVFGPEAGRLSGRSWRINLQQIPSGQPVKFNEPVNLNGLEISVGQETYFPGCDGTLGFQISIRNSTNRPIVLGLEDDNLQLYGSDQERMSSYMEFGIQSSDCYGSFSLQSIDAGETVLIAARSLSSLSGLSFVELFFELEGSPLDGLSWRLDLPR